jgi:hypothetical protein
VRTTRVLIYVIVEISELANTGIALLPLAAVRRRLMV